MKIVYPNSEKCKRSVRVAPVDCERCIRFKYGGKKSLFSKSRPYGLSLQDFRFPVGEVANHFAASFQRKLMRFEKLKDSSLLKPGELLVVLKNTAFFRLQQTVESGRLQFYRNRLEPVPWINRAKHGRMFRRPRTTNERRAHFSNNATEKILQSYGIAFKLRQKRKWHMLPNAYHDLSLRYQRTWKEHRGTQRKSAGSINRRIHSPPFWAW
jgi:hypothetical protein